jgi:hypothetical protein
VILHSSGFERNKELEANTITKIPSVIIKLSNGMTARFVMKNKPGN